MLRLLDLKSSVVALALLFVVGCICGGCSKSANPSVAHQSVAFDVAPAPIKETWDKGLAAFKDHHYLIAVTNLASLQSQKQLSAEQTAALDETLDVIGTEAFNAAEKGNPDATEAVLQLRKTGRKR